MSEEAPNRSRLVQIQKVLRILVRWVTCLGCGREAECPVEEMEETWPEKVVLHRAFLGDRKPAPEGVDYVVSRDRMPDGWVSLASYKQIPPGDRHRRDGGVVSEQGLNLADSGTYFCGDCAPEIKVTHPIHQAEDKS